MRLAARRDQRRRPRRRAIFNIRCAEIAGVRQQRFGLVQFFKQGVDFAQHRFKLLLVVGSRDHIDRNDQHTSRGHRGLRVVALLEAAPRHRQGDRYNARAGRRTSKLTRRLLGLKSPVVNLPLLGAGRTRQRRVRPSREKIADESLTRYGPVARLGRQRQASNIGCEWPKRPMPTMHAGPSAASSINSNPANAPTTLETSDMLPSNPETL